MTQNDTTTDENEDEIVLEAFLHLFGQDHAFREVFHPDNTEDAKEYIERLLEHKFDYEVPEGEWREVPGGDGIMYWPGDPYMDGGMSNPPSTKGYVMRKPVRTAADDALNAQPLNPQHFRTEARGSKPKQMVRSAVGMVRKVVGKTRPGDPW